MVWKHLRVFYCVPLIESSLKVHRLNSEKDPCCFPELFFCGFPLPSAPSLHYINAAVLYICLYWHIHFILLLFFSSFFTYLHIIYHCVCSPFKSPSWISKSSRGFRVTDPGSLRIFFLRKIISCYSVSGYDKTDAVLLLNIAVKKISIFCSASSVAWDANMA